MKDDIRNYTNISGHFSCVSHSIVEGLNVILPLELYPDVQNKDIVRVKCDNHRKTLDQLESKEEVGGGCRFGGLSLYQAIAQEESRQEEQPRNWLSHPDLEPFTDNFKRLWTQQK